MNAPSESPIGDNAFHAFRTFASVILGALIGLLISLPIVLPSGYHFLFVLPFIIVGGMIGYRRRESRGFLYFSFVAVLLLSSLVSKSLIVPPQ